jgi:hypothetical protein
MTSLNRSWRISEGHAALAVAKNLFYVFCEVWIEHRGFAGFFFVCFRQRNAFGDAAALSSWLGKVWATRLMDRERARYASDLERLKSSLESSNRQLQAELEKTIFVTRVHFETEFKALADIWRHLARAAMENLRTAVDAISPGETKESRLTARLDIFGNAITPFIDAVDQQSPFYPIEIYNQLDSLVRLIKSEGTDIAHSQDAFTPEWFKRGRENYRDFLAGVQSVSTLIRERISSLSVHLG